MASIKNVARLTKRCVLSNFLAERGLAITPLIVGQHGIGKSQIVASVAKDLGGRCLIVEGASIGEKELSGLPFAAPTTEGTTEVRYVKHYTINTIYALEKYYYEKALKEGFLDGSVRVEIDKNGNVVLHENGKSAVIMTKEDLVVAGEENRYKFGEFLSPETKFKLVESGEIKPIILFIDELNRTEVMIQKELMNIILNKNVSGYDLPWFCNIVAAINPCSQNSTYATNEMDPAQLDRFLKIKADANLDEWVDYALNKRMNTDVIEAIATSEQIFMHRDSSLEDTSELTPTPRSWEIIAHIYGTLDIVNKTKFFNAEERACKDDDFRVLARGKVGESAGRTLVENIARRDSNIKPEEIITMTSKEIEKKVLSKFNSLKYIHQKIISDNVAIYIVKNVANVSKWKTSSAKPEQKEKYMNWKMQIKEFTVNLNPTLQKIFCNKILDISERSYFHEIASYFSTEVLQDIIASKKAVEDLSKE